jgi:hypothetical protein
MTYTIATLFILYMLIRETTTYNERKQWLLERRDLYDRIMSKDLKEYKQETAEPMTYKPVDNSEEAEWAREQEEKKGMV